MDTVIDSRVVRGDIVSGKQVIMSFSVANGTLGFHDLNINAACDAIAATGIESPAIAISEFLGGLNATTTWGALEHHSANEILADARNSLSADLANNATLLQGAMERHRAAKRE